MIDKTAMMEDESLFRFLNSGDAPAAPSAVGGDGGRDGDGGDDNEPAASKARPVGRRAIRAQPTYFLRDPP